jgi:hypothetical protein
VKTRRYRRAKLNDFTVPCRSRCTERLVWALFGVVNLLTLFAFYLLWQRAGSL